MGWLDFLVDRARRRDSSCLLCTRYGAWALVAGASEGLGEAWARALAARGLNLLLVARRRTLLEALAGEISEAHGVHVLVCAGDLADPDLVKQIEARASELDVGLLVYNAAHSPVGGFLSVSPEEHLRAIEVNVRAPTELLRRLVPRMAERGRGAVVLMSSLAGNQGSPYVATYAATKAFVRVLAEGLWYECADKGIDVVACCAGAVKTPGYAAAAAGRDAPGSLAPEEVVESTLRALDRGPVVIPGRVNRVAAAVMTRVLPRRLAISIMAGSTGRLVPKGSVEGRAGSEQHAGCSDSMTKRGEL